MKYLIGIAPSDEISHQIKSVQQEFKSDRWNIALPPHITLMPPVEAILPVAQAIKLIKEAVYNIEKFQIEITGVDSFCNYHRTIYAAVKSSLELIDLQGKVEAISAKIGKINNAFKSFIPHITLSNDLTREEFNQQYPEIKKLIFNLKFICDKILLFVKNSNDRKYRIAGKVKLGD